MHTRVAVVDSVKCGYVHQSALDRIHVFEAAVADGAVPATALANLVRFRTAQCR